MSHSDHSSSVKVAIPLQSQWPFLSSHNDQCFSVTMTSSLQSQWPFLFSHNDQCLSVTMTSHLQSHWPVIFSHIKLTLTSPLQSHWPVLFSYNDQFPSVTVTSAFQSITVTDIGQVEALTHFSHWDGQGAVWSTHTLHCDRDRTSRSTSSLQSLWQRQDKLKH